ncbi:MAG TPA: hypothetical protein PLR76_00460 [Hyphomonas sp.]|nr:hypothetical protein [Hyphomonas sp.]
MSSEPISLSDPRMIAEFLRQSEFKSFFEKRFAVPPDYAALLFKNGQLIDAYKGGHFSVGGLVNQLKGLVGGSTHVGMMIADLKPFSVSTPLTALSKDKVEIAGAATLELQVDPEKPSNILGMMHGINRGPHKDEMPGRKALSKDDVLNRIRPHLTDRVFEEAIGRVNAAEIRGDRGLQDKIQADIMTEVERICGDIGLLVRAVSVEWAVNSEEVAEMQIAEARREQDRMDFRLEMIRREVERESEGTEIIIKSELDTAKLQNASEDELRMMALNSEVQFLDAREEAKRRQELEALDHEIRSLEVERDAAFKNQIATAKNDVDLAEIQKRRSQVDADIAMIQQKQADAMRKSGAFTELEITTAVQKQQADHLARLQQLDIQMQNAEADVAVKMAKAQNDHEIAKIMAEGNKKTNEIAAFRNMTPEQIMAINAGLSSDVATVLAEQARARGQSSAETMQAMRDMVEAATAAQIRSEEQARAMFKMGMDGAVGVAAGAGGGHAPAPSSAGAASEAPATVECPKCETVNAAKAKYCKQCGHKLRT